MGLDVYLYHCADRPAAKAVEDRYEEESSAIWERVAPGPYDNLTQDQKDAARTQTDALKTSLGLVDYSQHHSVTKIELPSAKYPEHLFKVGYFRSSYNGSGINHVMSNIGLPTLDQLFAEGSDDEYEFTPDWQASLGRVRDAIGAYREHLKSPMARVGILKVSPNIFGASDKAPQSEEDAFEAIRSEFERNRDDFLGGGYSNIKGDFYLKEPMEVIGMMPGSYEMMGRTLQCVYVAFRKEAGAAESYLQSLEIVEETIEYVLAKPDPQNYYFHWSS